MSVWDDKEHIDTQRLRRVVQWLRGQARAEKEPKAKAAFVEAANVALAIQEGRHDPVNR